MKQTVSTTTLFKAILVFTILFAAFLAIAIVYNKAYKMKNESVSILEKYEGTTDKAISIINNYLDNSGYVTKGKCEANEEYGMKDLESGRLELAKNNETYYYCVKARCTTSNCTLNTSTDRGNRIYYNFKLFFKFNLPFLGEFMTFEINGETKGINLYDNNQLLKN